MILFNKEKKKKYLIVRKVILLSFLFVFSFILFSNLIVLFFSFNKIYSNISFLPFYEKALVLGTSKYIANTKGAHNLFYKERIKSANDVFEAKKAKKLILSGSNPTKYYNEPEEMRKDLLKLGIPNDKIILDKKGFRTIDSIYRLKNVFKEDKVIIISQKFHLQRALFLAKIYNINAVGFISNDPKTGNLKVYIREIFARVKMLYDILFNL